MPSRRPPWTGSAAIDILINNAGTLVTIKPFMEVTTEEWMQIMETNTLGPFHCTKAVFPYMKEKGGRIINISSGTVFEGVPGLPHYLASKGAVMAFTRGMARELGDYNINVNSIAPGFTHSEGGDEFDRNKRFPSVPLDEVQMPMRCIKRPTYPEDLVGTAHLSCQRRQQADYRTVDPPRRRCVSSLNEAYESCQRIREKTRIHRMDMAGLSKPTEVTI